MKVDLKGFFPVPKIKKQTRTSAMTFPNDKNRLAKIALTQSISTSKSSRGL